MNENWKRKENLDGVLCKKKVISILLSNTGLIMLANVGGEIGD